MAINTHKIATWTNPITGEADRPLRSASSMKAVFDSNSNQLKDSINGLVDELEAGGGLDTLGITAVTGITGTVLSEQLAALKTYTDQTVVNIGAGDMARAMYDPTGKQSDVYAYADNAAGTVESALDASKADKAVTYTATLAAIDWTGTGPYTQEVTVTGITGADTPIIDLVLSPVTETALTELEAWAFVSKVETGTGTITATCFEDKPTVDLNLNIKVVY